MVAILDQPEEGFLRFVVTTATGQRGVTAGVPDGWRDGWHHVAGVYDGVELRLYVDGEAVETSPLSGGLEHAPIPVAVGRNVAEQREQYPGWLANAAFDRAAIHDRALSADELGAPDRGPGEATVLWLDFEDVEERGTFRSYGVSPFCCNGVVFADRTPQPELWQLKKAHQPVGFDAEDPAAGEVTVVNRHRRTTLAAFDVAWELHEDGRVLREGTLDLDVPAGERRTVTVPVSPPEPTPGAEYRLVLRVRRPEATAWAPAGHEVAFAEFPLPFDEPGPEVAVDDLPDLSIEGGSR